MAVASSDSVALGDVVIVGGGCYGSFYAGQLRRARERGAATWRRLLVVDRDPRCRAVKEHLAGTPGVELVVEEWGGFFDRYLAGTPDRSGPIPSRPAPKIQALPACSVTD